MPRLPHDVRVPLAVIVEMPIRAVHVASFAAEALIESGPTQMNLEQFDTRINGRTAYFGRDRGMSTARQYLHLAGVLSRDEAQGARDGARPVSGRKFYRPELA